MGQLDGRTALVTGGSRGIGRAIVERLVADGAAVVFSHAGNRAAADDVLAATAGRGRVETVAADLSSRAAPAALYDAAESALGPLDILVNPAVAVHAASKAAVEQFAACAARELGARGITVNAVSPGATDTDLLRGNNPGVDVAAAVAPLTPLGRLGRPDDIADVVAFLVGPDGRWITGQNLRAGDGWV